MVLVFSQFLLAQGDYTIIELQKQLAETNSDTNRVHILNQLAYELTYSQPDSAFLYASEAAASAKTQAFNPFTEKGEVLLHVSSKGLEADKVHINFELKDTGLGQ